MNFRLIISGGCETSRFRPTIKTFKLGVANVQTYEFFLTRFGISCLKKFFFA